ncbi:MAG: PEP-CTERM sorting domain-containing protein [Acidobacteriia bacterium]|nr:PEP-CTERM sorting domain-containing protein [Terriglobia bacterium]
MSCYFCEGPYDTDNHVLRELFDPWGLYPSFCMDRFCIGDDTVLGYIDASLGFDTTMAGVYVGGQTEQSWSGAVNNTATVSFFDRNDVVIGSLDVTVTSVPVFAGWRNPSGIGRIRVLATGSQAESITTIDNLTVEGSFPAASNDTCSGAIGPCPLPPETVPEPGSWGGMAAGLVLLLCLTVRHRAPIRLR